MLCGRDVAMEWCIDNFSGHEETSVILNHELLSKGCSYTYALRSTSQDTTIVNKLTKTPKKKFLLQMYLHIV